MEQVSFYLDYWQQLLGGALFPGIQQQEFQYMVYDTRNLLHPERSCFLALQNGKRDGHQFIAEAYEAGVRNFMVNRIPAGHFEAATFWVTENPLKTFQQMAKVKRSTWKGQVLGITGSNGKTVVKEWLFHLLESQFSAYRSPKSFNSQLGVPISIWEAPVDRECYLLEAGISQPGEMELLESMVLPDIGILTHFGAQHDEGFPDRKTKLLEKLQLFAKVRVLLASTPEEPYLETVQQFCREQGITLLLAGSDERATLLLELQQVYAGFGKYKARFNGEEFMVECPFTDAAAVENLALTLLAARHLEVPVSRLQELVPSLPAVEMRLKVSQGINDCTLINDSYSMDFDSFSIALDLLEHHEPGKAAVAILSDFPGGAAPALYAKAIERLNKAGVRQIFAIGSGWKAQPVTAYYENTEEFLTSVPPSRFGQQKILIKGARKYAFERIVKAFELRSHETVMEINLGAIAHNYRVFRQYIPERTGIMAMVKASAYGSGSVEIASLLERLGVNALGVAYPDEGVQLRKAGIRLPVLVMNATAAQYGLLASYELAPVIYNRVGLDLLLKDQEVCRQLPGIHIEFDTGMHRLGFEPEQAASLGTLLQQFPHLKVLSLMTHLAGADEAALDEFTQLQITRFNTAAKELEEALGYSPQRHIANTGGITRFSQDQYDMVRLGIGLYGIDSTGILSGKLQQAAGLYAVVTHVMNLKAGETVGYNRKGKLEKDTRVAVISIGYADGLNRALSNGKGQVWVNGHLAPIIGNVCMDMTMIDVNGWAVNAGDRVCIFGPERPVELLASQLNTIPYEVLTGVSSRVPRIFWKE